MSQITSQCLLATEGGQLPTCDPVPLPEPQLYFKISSVATDLGGGEGRGWRVASDWTPSPGEVCEQQLMYSSYWEPLHLSVSVEMFWVCF